MKDGVSEADLRGKLPASLRELNPMLAAGQYLLELTDPKQDHPVVLAAQLQETAGAWLEWAEPDFIQTWLQSTPNANPNDPLFTDAANYQWHLNNLAPNTGIAQADARVQKAWTNSGIMGDGSVVIAVVDDGVQSTHPDLTVSNAARQNVCGKIGDVHGWNFVDDNSASDPVASPSHGTSVAGVAAATGNNTIPTGVTGACQNCPVVSARIFAGSTSTSASSIANAIAYAACTAEVINNSWGGGSESSAITAAVQNAIAGVGTVKRGTKGTPVLFATGNSGSGYNQIAITVQDPGTYTLEWRYEKDGSVASGYDTAWLDYVKFPTGVGTYTVESFEGNACASLPAGWTSTGNAAWVPVDAEVRAASLDGGHCSVKAGTIGDSESSGIKVTMTLVPGKLFFSAWVSSEPWDPSRRPGVTTSCPSIPMEVPRPSSASAARTATRARRWPRG